MALSSQTNKIIPAFWIYCVLCEEISEVEERPFTSSLNIYPEACCKKGGGWAE
jgi:hypothetical protein